MPPQPPEETSVLSHRPSQDSNPLLGVHPKDPLAFSSSKNSGLKDPLSIEYSMMAQQQQQNRHHRFSQDIQQDQGHVWKSSFDNRHRAEPASTGGMVSSGVENRMHNIIQGPGEFGISKCSDGHSTAMSASGLQPRRGMQATVPYPSGLSIPSPDKNTTHLPTPSMTPTSLMEPMSESNVGSRNGYGHYFDQKQRQPQYQDQQQPGSVYNGLQSNMSSPLNSNCSPIETFHSAHASPLVQHREYESLQSTPQDFSAHYRVQDAFTDVNATSTKAPPPYAPTAQGHGLKSSHVSLWKKAGWVGFTMAIFLLPYSVLKACFHLKVSAGAWQTSLTYGMLMAADFFAVITFSALNRRRVNQRVKNRDPHWVGMTTGILAVGYREDPILLEGCLKSLKAMRYQRNQRVMLVVDGNDQQDEYMAQIFLKIFGAQGAAVFRPNFLCVDREASDKERDDLVRQLAYHPGPVCIMQPHRGKRSAMYTGFAAFLQQGIESVVVTDSDTYLDPAVCKELVFALTESPIIGAATGDVRIYNTGTWVSFLSSLRYWFAFNLERGAQSYHSVVNCVSGPLGIYRMSIVADVMDDWAKQSFLGVLCTYGDDRHLTNLVLRQGYKVKFSQFAICYTDTPIRFIAWVTQQTRWSKSFFREIPIQLGCIHLHSPWMTYALLYQLIYPMMMVYNLVNCIYFGTGSQICWWLVSITFVGMVKTLYAVKITGDKKFFFTTAYGFLYMLGYVPAKLYAALTLYDNSWGTSARLFRNFTQLQNYIAPVTWVAILILGFLHNPSRYFQMSPQVEGQPPPFITDVMIFQALIGFAFIYSGIYICFFLRTGIVTREYKRDFSYEELYENMTSYTYVDGGKRKVARFEV